MSGVGKWFGGRHFPGLVVRIAAVSLFAATAFVSSSVAQPATAEATSLRGTCQWSMWRSGLFFEPQGPIDCVGAFPANSKYVYGRVHYEMVDPWISRITAYDISGNRNGLGGASSTWPGWRMHGMYVNASPIWSPEAQYRYTYWDDPTYRITSVLVSTGSTLSFQHCYDGNQWHSAFCASSRTMVLDHS